MKTDFDLSPWGCDYRCDEMSVCPVRGRANGKKKGEMKGNAEWDEERGTENSKAQIKIGEK